MTTYLFILTIFNLANVSCQNENRIFTESSVDGSSLSIGWLRLDKAISFNFQYDSVQDLQDGQELRLCFDSIRINQESYQREIKSVVFYGEVDSKKFTHVAVPKEDFPDMSHEFWVCSQPRDSAYMQLIGLENE